MFSQILFQSFRPRTYRWFECEHHRGPVYKVCSWFVQSFLETSQTYHSGHHHLQLVTTCEPIVKSVSSELIWLSDIQPVLSWPDVSRVTFRKLLERYLSKRKQVIYIATLGWWWCGSYIPLNTYCSTVAKSGASSIESAWRSSECRTRSTVWT